MWHIFYNWLNSIHKAEWFVLVALAVHIVAVPYTEADEEAFNMDAIHDILYHQLNFAKYHHLEHPGLVSRTFIGPLAVASIALPFRTIFGLLRLSKFWTLLAVRFVLGLATLTPFFLLARSIERRYYFFDSRVGTFLRIITATQFYFLYYASRPTSNTYAMILFLLVYYRVHEKDYILAAILATIAVFHYQFELIWFFIFFFLINFKKEEVITQYRIAFVTLLISLAIAMPIDAYFWGSYFVWPEARTIKFVFWDGWWEYKKYNFIAFLRFFTAVPRSLLLWYFLYEEGYRIHQRLQTTLWIKFCLPAKIFFYLYSIVGRNEFHFILYISQMYNASAAVYCAHYWKRFLQARALNFRKQFFVIIGVLLLNAAISIQLMYASNHSLSGSKSVGPIAEHYSRDKPINIHMDKYCAETGITRFVQFYDNWTYNKTENLQPADAFQFDYILIGSTNKDKLIEDFAKANLSFPFADYFSIEAYHQVLWRLTFHYYWIPLYKPEVHYERAIVMKKRIEDE